MGDRSTGLKKCLKDWEVDVLLINSPAAEIAFNKHGQYVRLQKEKCSDYDDMKRAFIGVFGVTVTEWIVSLTNYFVRDSIMIKKGFKDKVVESPVELVNDYFPQPDRVEMPQITTIIKKEGE